MPSWLIHPNGAALLAVLGAVVAVLLFGAWRSDRRARAAQSGPPVAEVERAVERQRDRRWRDDITASTSPEEDQPCCG